ncbi:DNA-binding transcriptional regulator YhcF (GntR family) [Catenulispora sp. GP43]|uniref:GntR family transcriptional regulator n=1 Tax=Catenulispora sp. GP43 TaxID=3156263 RepID=UPI003513D741
MTITTPNRPAHPAVPLYRQITALICRAVLAGQLTQGATLPTRPRLAETLGVSVATVDTALAELSFLGIVKTSAGRPARIDLRPSKTPLGSTRMEVAGMFAVFSTEDLAGPLPVQPAS